MLLPVHRLVVSFLLLLSPRCRSRRASPSLRRASAAAAAFVRSFVRSFASFVCGSARARVAAFGSHVRSLSLTHTHTHITHARALALAIIIVVASLAHTLAVRAEYTARCYRNFIYINLASPLVALISFPLRRCCFCPFRYS